MANRKLSSAHVDDVCRLAALGTGKRQIARLLADGVTTESGQSLPAVVVDEGTVRYRLRSPEGKAAVEDWRQRLFGDVYSEPLAWAGHRISELSELFREAKRQALRPADSRAGVQDAQRWMRLAVSMADAIRSEMFRIEPEAPKLTAHVSVAGKDAHELAAGLAEKLSEYARAGVLPEAINVLRGGAPGLDAVAIEATLADVPKEGTTSTTPTSTPTPGPPPRAAQGRGRR